MSPPASCVAAIRLPVPGPNQHSRPLQRVQASECQPVDGFGTSSLRSPTAFHQSAQIIDYLSTMHDFDVAPLRRVETTSDRRPSLLLASQIPHQPKTASGSRVTSSSRGLWALLWSGQRALESQSMEGLLPVSLRRTGQAKSLRHPALHSHVDACWLGKHTSVGSQGESTRHNLRHLVLCDALFTHSYSYSA